MPNWCQNELVVRGPAETVAAFKDAAAGPESKLDFQKLRPMPESEDQQKEESKGGPIEMIDSALRDAQKGDNSYESPGWYHWRVANWGTKWNVGEVVDVVEKSPTEVSYRFDTAWTPPEPLVRFLAEKFNALSFELKYVERGAGFAGHLVLEAGAEISHQEGDPAEFEFAFAGNYI